MQIDTMQVDRVKHRLSESGVELRDRFGVRRLALFGSAVRGEAGPESDVDLLVDFDDRPVGLLHLIGTQQFLARVLRREVDLVLRRAVLPELRDVIHAEAVDVFDTEEVDVSSEARARGD